jgi:tetratricopeptide (TPR) repeat protein
MIRKHFFAAVVAIALFMLSTIVASAQYGPLRGHVKFKQADSTVVPAVNAVIDVFRTDISGNWNTKTDKKGEFRFAGLPYIGTYTIAASLPNAQPTYIQGINVKQDNDYELVLTPGDGHRLTIDEIKKGTAGASGSSAGGRPESAEDKAKLEEYNKKKAENERNSNINEIVGRTFKAANAALVARNYDEAIKQSQEGLAADPEQAALYTMIAEAFRARGVDRYNAALKSPGDDSAKNAAFDLARQDFRAAAESATKAVDILKKETPASDAAGQAAQTGRKLAALSTRAESMRLFVMKVDQSKTDDGLAAFEEYIAAQPDPVKKAKSRMDAAQMLLDAGAGDKAFAEFKKILAETPDNPDANLGAGLALYSTGDKTKYQEAANYLAHFVEIAPDTNKLKSEAKDILANLKNTENVVPEKITPGRRRPASRPPL